MAMERAVKLLEEYADAKIQKGTVIYDKTDKEEKKIDITVKDINSLLGTDIKLEECLDVFRRLNFEYEVNGEIITVTAPSRRLDLAIKEDLIEEVGRIYGVDNITGKLPVVPMKIGSVDKVQRGIRSGVNRRI